jgi:catechol 2,3-dioxygenase-like lactoylglutathione lyase family enzyme
MKVPRSAPFVPRAILPPVVYVPPHRRLHAERILRISRAVADLRRAETFYRDGLGFRATPRRHSDRATLAALGIGGGDPNEIVMRLGAQEISLVRFTGQGQPYPVDSESNDLWFQHLAIVVSDMDAAYAHLSSRIGWRPVSENGPQLLPPVNGAVRAFKFRDPDGHPLELIWFPPGKGRRASHRKASRGLFLGIDHSALSIASTARSLPFYRGLGLRVSNRSLNCGPAQARLDGLPGARVRVTGLRPASAAGPRLELLAYQPPGRAIGMNLRNDLVTQWVTLAVSPLSGTSPCAVRDPDGHCLVLIDHGAGATGVPV